MVTYPKEMKELAALDSKALITIDVPGMTYQTPATNEQVKELHALCQKWWNTELKVNKDGLVKVKDC